MTGLVDSIMRNDVVKLPLRRTDENHVKLCQDTISIYIYVIHNN